MCTVHNIRFRIPDRNYLQVYNLTTYIMINNYFLVLIILRTAEYIQHGHPITGILVSIEQMTFQNNPTYLQRCFDNDWINLDRVKNCQTALCLPMSSMVRTLPCSLTGSKIFTNPPNLHIHVPP